jgi:hypothetical protein
MKFIMRRDRTVASTLGHAIEFKKGVPTHVPPALIKQVLEVGGEPADAEELKDDPRDEKPAGGKTEPGDPDEREKQILEAMELIVTEGKRESFTAGGAPHNKALTALLGWAPDAKERDAAWTKFQQDAKKD